MESRTFIDKLFLGSLDATVFHGQRAPKDQEKVDVIVEKVKALLKEHSPESIESEGRIPSEMLKKMAEAGLFGLSIPREYGGLGFNQWEYLMTIEELVKLDISIVLSSIAHLSIGVKGIHLFGSEAQKRKYLVPAASGEMIFSYALTEPHVGSDAQHIETRAELSPDGSHYLLNGRKTYITNANYAGGFTVFAQMDPARPGFMGAFIVETPWPGIKIGKDMPKMGLKASSTAAIQFKDVKVPRENLLGEPGEGFKIAMTILNYGRLGLGAASLGMMGVSLDDMMQRSSSRVQFGVPIKSFSLVQEKMVRARVNQFILECIDDFIVSQLEGSPHENVAMETSHCKLFGTTRAWDTLYDALQVAGGSGYIATQPYEKRMRDFRVATVFEGTTEIHSIYPPLFMMRKIQKDLQAISSSRPRQLKALAGMLLTRNRWPGEIQGTTMKRAVKTAKTLVRTLRRLLFLAMVVHGGKATQKQFLLRRITTLSLYAFGILACVAKLSRREAGGGPRAEDLKLLDYFVAEARQVHKENGRFLDTRKERLHRGIFADLFKE